MLFPLLLLTLISATGFLLYTRKNLSSHLLNLMIALGAGAMLSVALIHILPEAIEISEYAVYAFLCGFLAIYLIEELLTPHSHDHVHGDHYHEDPHDHKNHVALVAWIAITIHTVFDGFGIRASMGLSETIGYTVLFGVAIHQIPVSLSLAAIFRESNLSKNTQILLMTIFVCAAAFGYTTSDVFLQNETREIAGMVAAFAGGSLLYVATVDLIPIIHNQGKRKIGIMFSFLLGAIIIASIRFME